MYRTISQQNQYIYEEKRSEFIAILAPVSARIEVMNLLDSVKKDYPDARHHCWAYVIGNPAQPKTAAFNDDGEPAGTAGKPKLHVLTQRGAGDCCAVVVRYFGGIKLGAGGLVRAYGKAVSKALDSATWKEVIPQSGVELSTSYEDEPHIRHFINKYDAVILDQQYGSNVVFNITIPKSNLELFSQDVIHKTAGRTVLKDHT